MADHNVNINIKDTSKARAASQPRGAGKVTTQLDPTSLQKLNRVFKDAVSKSFNLQKLGNTIAKAISKEISSQQKRQPGGAATKGDVNRIVKQVSGDLAKQISKSLISALSKPTTAAGKPGLSDRRIVESISSLDKHIQSAIKNLNTQLQKQIGGQLGPDVSKSIANAVSGAVSKAIPKSLDKATKDLSTAVSGIQSIVREISTIAGSIKRMRQTGGGVDITEIGPILTSLKRLITEFSKLPQELKKARESAMSVAKEEKQLYSDFSKALTELRKATREKVTRVKESAAADPQQFARAIAKELSKVATGVPALKGTNVEKVLSGLEKKIETVGDITKAVKGLEKEIRNQVQTGKISTEGVKNLVGAINTLNNNLKDLPKTMGGGEKSDKILNRLEKFTERTGKLLKTVNIVLDEDEIKKQIESAVKKARPKIGMEMDLDVDKIAKDLKSSLDNVLDAVSKKIEGLGLGKGKIAVEELKKARAGGGAGTVRDIILDLKQMPELKEFADELKEAADAVALTAGLKGIDKSAQRFVTELDKTSDTLKSVQGASDIMKKREARRMMGPTSGIKSALTSHKLYRYPREVIPPGDVGFKELEKPAVKFGAKAKDAVQKNVDELAKSLKGLQEHMVSVLGKELEEGSSGWKIVRESSEQAINEYFKLATGGSVGNIKQAGKQWSVQIADIQKIRKDLGKGFEAASPAKAVEAFKQSLIEGEVVGRGATVRPQLIAKWVKSASKETIESMDVLSESQKKSFVELKDKFKAPEVAAEMAGAVKSVLGTDKEIERVFRNTFAVLEAERKMMEGFIDDLGRRRQPVVKSLAVPAAKLTETGTAAFETAAGSLRALPKFATFVTGFEKMYKDLLDVGRLPLGETFGGRIRRVGVKPAGAGLKEAESLAREMLKAYAGAFKGQVTEFYRGAAAPRGLELERADVKSIGDLESEIEKVIGTFRDLPEAERSIDSFIDSMNKIGVSAYDVVKSLDAIKFENIYDVLKKTITKPLTAVGKEPYFERSVRKFEETSRQLEQLLPLIEPGRPRRGAHQEAIVQLFARTTPVYKDLGVKMGEQKDLIKDLNIRLGEMVSEFKELKTKEGEAVTKRLATIGLPETVRELSTLGIPEALAGSIKELRPGKAPRGLGHLADLQATTLKLYTENLRELAPFGAQFQNWGRNITNVTNALSSASDDTIDSMKKFGSSVSGIGTEFPTLRTEREREVVAGGRYGRRGFGLNVLAELRTTSSTFEDQVLISGKIADALTSVTKTLVRPGVAGRLRKYEEERAAGVGPVDPKLLRDVTKAVGEASDEIQSVLGVPERYKGRADRALIESVTKAITVVRGREVEVQAAKLAEVFLNYFGRKITTRFGSKGVGITPTGGPGNLREILKYYGEKPIKVLPKAERTRAGLGVAVMPKTMGQLASEIIEKSSEELEKAGMAPKEINSLKTSLINSGNRFMIDIFKRAGILAADEITIEKKVFTKLKNALKTLDENLASDIAGIKGLKEIYGKRVGGPTFEERPIDVTISAYGAGKRGLQTEVLESVMSNVMGLRPGMVPGGFQRPATMKTTVGGYQELLKGKGALEPGLLSKYSEALGFAPAVTGRKEDVFKQLKTQFLEKGIAEDLADRMAELETLSSYYVDVVDSLSKGKPRKGLVGQKFTQIVEEPHLFADWTKREVEKGVRGEKLNLPAFGAYSAIFGEQSAFMEEIKKSSTIDSKEAWEYIKALQTVNDQSDEFKKLLTGPLKTVDLFDIKDFTEATGTLEEFKGTVLDVQKFPGPFKVKIPVSEKGRTGEYEEMYIPGAPARETYEEPLIAGERAPKVVARRLANLISAAKKVELLRSGFAEVESQISDLEQQLKVVEDPAETESINKNLSGLFKELESLYAQPERVEATKRDVITNVGNMLKRVQELASKKTGREDIEEIIEKMLSVMSETAAPPAGFRATGVSTKFSEKQVMEKLIGTDPSFEQYSESASRMADLIIGVSEGSREYLRKLEAALAEVTEGLHKGAAVTSIRTEEKYFRDVDVSSKAFEDRLKGAIDRYRQRVSNVTKIEKAAESGYLATLAGQLGVTVEAGDKEFERALASLSRAKIDYYNTLVEEVLGKGKAIEKVLLSRTIPAVMGKAIAATVDKTDDLEQFSRDLRGIYGSFAGLEKKFRLDELEDIAKDILDIREEHAEKIGKLQKKGVPVLKQYELGVPATFAKKLPVKYRPKYKVKGRELETIPEGMREEVETSLFDILKEAEALTTGEFISKPGAAVKPPSKRELQEYVEKELVPYIESVRYPFTGISSVQPYRAKLAPGGMGRHALAVPGMPEMDIEKFDKTLEKVREIVAGMEETRAELGDEEIKKRQELTQVIDDLHRAISRVLPKYAAHEQKLDFDGDAIEIHSAVTRDAREDIKKHFDSLTDDIDSTRAVFRDFFTYGARQIPSTDLVLSEMAQAFEKKFPFEKGFEFLGKPYLEKEMGALTTKEQLDVLKGRPGARSEADILRDITEEFVRAPEEREKTLEAIESTIDKTGSGLINAIEALGGDSAKLVKAGIKTRAFEEKYKDAIEAQLYKIHTGPETESLYRLTRIAESFTGFGGGQIAGGPSRATEAFKKRWPGGAALGADPGFEFQTMINELLRFGIQKGMDVKHAGEFPVAGEVVRELSKGEMAAEKLFDRITDKNEEAFADLRDFAEQNEIAVRRRLERLPATGLREQARGLRRGRGMGIADIESMARPELTKEIVGMVGFKGFLVELAKQIKEQAIEGLIKEMGVLPPTERARKTRGAADIRSWATREIEAEAAGLREWTPAINIKRHITAQRQPLYMKRAFGAGAGAELKSAEARGIKLPDPKFVFAGMSEENIERYTKRYRAVQATSINLARDLKRATEDIGGGAYADMVTSSIQNIYDEQEMINKKLLSQIGPEGFKKNIPDSPLVERVLSGVDVADFTKKLLGDPEQISEVFLDRMKKQVEEYSGLVGVGMLTQAEKFDIKEKAFEEFGRRAGEALLTEGMDPEQFKMEVDKYANAWIVKAEALKQMDKIIQTLQAKKHEALAIRAILPDPADLKKVTKETIKPFVADQMREAVLSRTEREKMVRAFAPKGRERAIERGMAAERGPAERVIQRRGAKGDCIPVTNCDRPLDVFIVGASGDVKFNVGEERGLTTAAKTRGLRETINVVKEKDPSRKELSEIRKTLIEIQKQTSGFAQKLPQEAFKSLSEAYKSSGLAGGGAFGTAGGLFGAGVEFSPEKLAKSQIQAMMGTMLGIIEKTKELEAEQFLGSALHSKIQEKLKKQFGPKVEFEKFTKYEDETAGIIGGRMDAIFRNTAGKVEKVMDIKTVSAGVIEELGEGALTLDEALNKEISAYTRQKIEDVASQLAVYMAALQQSGMSADDLVAEAALYSKLEPEREPTIIKIKPAEVKDRLQTAMNSIAKARELVQKYIIEGASMEDLPVEMREMVKAVSERFERIKGGTPRFARTISPKFFDQIEATSKELTEGQLEKYVEMALKYYGAIKPETMAAKKGPREFTEKRERVRQERKIRETMEAGPGAMGKFEAAPRPSTAGDLYGVFENLAALHEQAKSYQDLVNKLDIHSAFKGLADPLKEALGKVMEQGRAGGASQELAEVVKNLEEEGAISHKEAMDAWKLYRIALGDFFIREAADAKRAIDEAGDDYIEASKAYGRMQAYVNRFKETIIGGLGKRTDIYAPGGAFVSPELARGAGVYEEPKEIRKRAAGPLGESEQLRRLFKMVVETEKAPIFKARDIVASITEMDEGLISLLNNTDLVLRKGEELKDAWSFEPLIANVTKLRKALKDYTKFNVRDDFTTTQIKNIQDVITYLGQVERSFSRFGKESGKEWGQTGVVKVLPWLDPKAQKALHMQNIASLRDYFKKTESAGGPEVGERFTYMMKVLDQTGNIVKNTAFDFNKYGESLNKAGEKTGAFTEKQRDLIKYTQGANRTFGAALRRVAMWGGAATVVYGGISQLKTMIGTIADIETAVAQLRMVMSPLETDFGRMSQAAVDFAKQYGTPVTEVLKGMRIFAQQGLAMADVIDRTRTATLASNVTTLSAKDATEAITAASKVFRQEGEATIRFIDAWSEVEAKHAITSEDMALALRKAASAGKNAGFTFDELNGVIASIGSVTRQTGKEVGTSLRFIFRRLATEKGPKELAKIGIPVMTEEGELRRGFDILQDLAGAWNDLTTAQKMNISQSVGGTRQYNQVLVLMDNWEEAESALMDSINSTGSAQRRNQEVMKTYAKQLEQTKASAVELQMAFGKVYLPIAKFGLKTMRGFFETVTAIPNVVKAGAVGIALLITYIAKGDKLISSLATSLGKGGQLVSQFFDAFRKGVKIAGFETMGLGKGLDLEGLKKVTEGKSLDDFHSALGKTAFILANVGQAYNQFVGEVVSGSGKAAEAAGETLEKIGNKVTLFNQATLQSAGFGYKAVMDVLQKRGLKGLLAAAPKLIGSVAAIGVEAAGQATKVTGQAIDALGETVGAGGQRILRDFAASNTGLVKSIAPLAVTTAALIPAFKALYDYYGKTAKSARDYEQASYGIKRAGESELSTIRQLVKEYDMMQRKLEDAQKAAQPEVRARRVELGTYEAPILTVAKIQEQAARTANNLAKANINLVRGYDGLGNAVLKNVGDFREYLKMLDKLKVKELAKADIDVLEKYIYDLTQIEGPEKWKFELRKFIKEAPVIGGVIGKHIQVAPAKALDEVTKSINSLIALKNKYPLSTAADKDVKKTQSALDEIRKGYQQAYKDFKRVMSNIRTEGLDSDEIAEIFAAPELRKGFELMVDVEPRFRLVPQREFVISDSTWRDITKTMKVRTGIEWQDVLGAEVMKRAFPGTATVLDASKVLTEARLETKGLTSMEGKKLALQIGKNYIITFYDEIVKGHDIAGEQAVLKMAENADGILEWMVSYFNTKTLKVEERPLTEDMRKLIENVFPINAMQDELEDRIDVFSQFVSGAAAGLRGVSVKDFKRDFSLGERFFSQIPTTTILQGPKGFTPGAEGAGRFGVSPFQKGWQETNEQFFFEPMKKYKREIEKLQKLQLEGLEEAGSVDLAQDTFKALSELQEVLKNNQVVLQYRSVFVDFTKTMEESSRALRENIAIEKSRIELQTRYTGVLKGIPEGLESINLGVRKFTDLTAEQRVVLTGTGFLNLFGGARRTAIQAGETNIRRSAAIARVEAADRAIIALETIRETAMGFEAIASPERMKELVAPVIAGATPGEALLLMEAKRGADSQSQTVDRLDSILENMGDEEATERYLGSITDYLSLGAGWSQKTVNAMERIARIREKAMEEGDQNLVMQTDKMLDNLSLQLLKQEGLKRGIEEVDKNFTLTRKRFGPEEFAQRSFGAGGLDLDAFLVEMKKFAPEVAEKFGLYPESGKAAFDDSEKVKELLKLRKGDDKTQLIQSKTLSKAALAIGAFEHFNKGHSSKVIDKLEGQEGQLQERIKQAKAEGKDFSKLSLESTQTRKAIEAEQERLDFHKMAQSISLISAGTIELARAMGLTETQIKVMGVGAATTYAAVKLASSVMGKDLPESAKKFEQALVRVGKEVILEGKEPGMVDAVKLKLAGRDLVSSFKESVKGTTGVAGKELEKVAGKYIDTEVESGKIRADAQASVDTQRIRQLFITYLAATFDGYIAARQEESTKLATLNARAEKEGKVFLEGLMEYIDEADKAAKAQLERRTAEVRKSGKKVSVPQKMESLMLDTDEEFDTRVKNLKDYREKYANEVKQYDKELGKASDKFSLAKLAESIKMELERLEISLASQAKKFDLERMFGGTALQAGRLRGFAGEPSLAPMWEEMSVGQRLFASGSDDFRTRMEEFAYFQQTLGTRVGSISGLEDQLATIEKNIEKHKELGLSLTESMQEHEALTKQIDKQKSSLESAGKEWEVFASRIRIAMRFEDVIKGIEDAQKSLVTQQRMAIMPEVREFRREEGMLPGGGHPLAPVMVTPEMERMGMSVGILLKNFESTASEVEKVRLMFQLMRASGEERVRLSKQLSDLDILEARKIGAGEQQFENELIRQQGQNLSEMLSALETFMAAPGVGAPEETAIRELTKDIRSIMTTFYERRTPEELIREVTQRGFGPGTREFQQVADKIREAQERGASKVFRGVLAFEQQTLKEEFIAIRKLLGETALTPVGEDFVMALDPVHKELKMQTALLEKLAEKEGVDVKAVKEQFEPKKEAPTGLWNWLTNPKKGGWRDATPAKAGGRLFGEGGPKEDKIPIWASAGEFMVAADKAKEIGYGTLEHINKYGEIPRMQAGGRVPSIYAEPKKGMLEKAGDFLWEMVPFHQYMTKSGRMLAESLPEEARVQQNIGEFMKLLDFAIGGIGGGKAAGKKGMKEMGSFTKRLLASERGAIDISNVGMLKPSVRAGKKVLSRLEESLDPAGYKRMSVHDHSRRILESADADEIASMIPEGAKYLSSGEQAVVLELPGNKVMRIGTTGEPPVRPKESFMLQAEKHRNFGDIDVEILPKAEPVIDDFYVELMKTRLKGSGYELIDAHPGNLALYKDKLVAIDPGAIKKLQKGGYVDDDRLNRLISSKAGTPPGIITAKETQEEIRQLAKTRAKEIEPLEGKVSTYRAIEALSGKRPDIDLISPYLSRDIGTGQKQPPLIHAEKGPILKAKREAYYAGMGLREMAAADPKFKDLGSSVQRLVLLRSTLDSVIGKIEDPDSIANNLTFEEAGKESKADYEKNVKGRIDVYKQYRDKINEMLFRIEEGERTYDPGMRKEFAKLLYQTAGNARPIATFKQISDLEEREATHLTGIAPFGPGTFGRVMEPKFTGVMKPDQLKAELMEKYVEKEKGKYKKHEFFKGMMSMGSEFAGPDYASSLFWQELFSKLMPNIEVPSYQKGIGSVPENQLAFLHKNETVLPATGSSSLEKVIDRLEDVLNNTEIKIEDKTLKIEDKTIEVNVPESIKVDAPETISVDLSGALEDLESTIKSAFKAAGGGSVGAERMDSFEELVREVNDKVLNLKGKLEDEIEVVNTKMTTDQGVAQVNIEARFNSVVADLTKEINLANSSSSSTGSEINRVRQHLETLIEDARRIAIEARML